MSGKKQYIIQDGIIRKIDIINEHEDCITYREFDPLNSIDEYKTMNPNMVYTLNEALLEFSRETIHVSQYQKMKDQIKEELNIKESEKERVYYDGQLLAFINRKIKCSENMVKYVINSILDSLPKRIQKRITRKTQKNLTELLGGIV